MNLEQLMSDTLQERAEETAYPSTRYWDVVDRAAAIRNRRRHHRVLAVAASAAVVVPLALAGHSLHRTLDGAPAGPRPTHAPSHPPSHHPKTHHQPTPPPTFAEIPRGQAPGVAYLAGDTVVEPDGSTQALPPGSGGNVDWGVPLGNGYLLHANREVVRAHLDKGESVLKRVDGDTVTDLGCGSYYLGTENGGGRVAYWVASSCATYRTSGVLYVADTETGQATPYLSTTPALGSLEPVGIVGGRVIAEADTRTASSVVSIGPDGSVRPVRGLHYAFAFDPVHQWVIGETVTGRNVVLDPVTGKVVWSTPYDSWTLNSVSPDGRVMLGIKNNSAVSTYALLDATDGHVIARIQPEGPPNFQSVAAEVRGFGWDHDALLSNVVAYKGNAILRSDASGTKVATQPAPYRSRRNGGSNPSFYGLLGP